MPLLADSISGSTSTMMWISRSTSTMMWTELVNAAATANANGLGHERRYSLGPHRHQSYLRLPHAPIMSAILLTRLDL
eukprot:6213844-Pleurochrysis_carterae.AAC.8